MHASIPSVRVELAEVLVEGHPPVPALDPRWVADFPEARAAGAAALAGARRAEQAAHAVGATPLAIGDDGGALAAGHTVRPVHTLEPSRPVAVHRPAALTFAGSWGANAADALHAATIHGEPTLRVGDADVSFGEAPRGRRADPRRVAVVEAVAVGIGRQHRLAPLTRRRREAARMHPSEVVGHRADAVVLATEECVQK